MKLKIFIVLGITLIIIQPLFSQTNDKSYSQKIPSPDGTGKYYMGREIAIVQGYEGASFNWIKN